MLLVAFQLLSYNIRADFSSGIYKKTGFCVQLSCLPPPPPGTGRRTPPGRVPARGSAPARRTRRASRKSSATPRPRPCRQTRPARPDAGGAASEAVDHDARERAVKAQPQLFAAAREHAEDILAVFGQIKIAHLCVHIARLPCQTDRSHLIHAVMRQPVTFRMRDEIIIFILPAQRIGAGGHRGPADSGGLRSDHSQNSGT